MSAIQHDDQAAAALVEEKKDLQESSAGSEIDHELDGIHDGLEFPTEEERATLRRVPDRVPWNAYCELLDTFEIPPPYLTTYCSCVVIAVVEFAERFSVFTVRLFSYPF